MSLQYLTQTHDLMTGEGEYRENPNTTVATQSRAINGVEIRTSLDQFERLARIHRLVSVKQPVRTGEVCDHLEYDCARRTVRRYLQRLEEYGLLQSELRHAGGHSYVWSVAK